MKILILEDYPPIAHFIEETCRSILGNLVKKITVTYTLDDAIHFLEENIVDLCLLDLNLSGDDGFELLRKMLSRPFQTIVISAYGDRALTAYEFGVIDFIKKPFSRDRLQLAMDRYQGKSPKDGNMRSLIYRKQREYFLLPLSEVLYFKSDRVIVEAYKEKGRPVIVDKHLNQLEFILPSDFIRIHRSYIVNSDYVDSFGKNDDGNGFLRLKGDIRLPVGRRKYKYITDKLIN